MRAKCVVYVVIVLLWVISSAPVRAIECVFRNPVIQFGQDPSVIAVDGDYYLVQSTAGTLTLTIADTLTGLGRTQPIPIFTPPPALEYSYDVWAPELFHHDNRWYIYFAATRSPGANPTHRMFAIQSDTADPLGSWSFAGRIYDPANDFWAIDGAVFEWNEQLYMIWSGWETTEGDFPQNLYIASMSDPLTISGERVLIAQPDQPWEQSVAALLEGPQPFIYDDTLSIVYSADASWSAAYSLGLLHMTGHDPLDPSSWEKRGPIFDRFDSAEGAVYGPGHNASPVLSPDGSESWLVYHAIATEFGGWDERGIRMQPFSWGADETPVLGDPIPAEIPLEVPSGDPCGLIPLEEAAPVSELAPAPTPAASNTYVLDGTPLVVGNGLINTAQSYSVAAWVALDRLDVPMSIISQEGGLNSSFALEYVDGTFSFTQFAQIGAGAARAAVENYIPQVGEWTHLAGIYDLADRETRLYLNGELVATLRDIDAWDARLATVLGGVRQRGQRVNPLFGTLRDLRLYAGALSDADISAIYAESSTR